PRNQALADRADQESRGRRRRRQVRLRGGSGSVLPYGARAALMRIDWLESAFLDLHRVRETIRQFNPVAAQRTIACIEAAARNLARFPEMGRSGEVAQTRELMIPGLPYDIVYRVSGVTAAEKT